MSPTLISQPIPSSFFVPQEGTTFTWLGMAGALINARGTILLIDPLIVSSEEDGQLTSEEGYRLLFPLPVQARDIPRLHLVMYTHADDDHFGKHTARVLAEQTDCHFLAPGPVRQLLSELGISEDRLVTAVDYLCLPLAVSQIQVTPALHDWQEVNPWQRNDCCGYLVESPDGVIWHPGDTRLIDELLEYKNVDVLFFDVAAVESHLGPQGSAQLAKSCGAKALIAYHYGTFDLPPGSFGNCDPEDALPYLADAAAKYLQPQPGEILKLPLDKSRS